MSNRNKQIRKKSSKIDEKVTNSYPNDKIIIGEYNLSIILTYIGVLIFAMTGIRASVLSICQPAYESFNYIDEAIICLILSGVCDLFDGAVARRIKRTERACRFGEQLDSLADIVSFGVQPVLLVTAITKQYNTVDSIEVLQLIVVTFYLFCVIQRLAWFNVTHSNYTGYFMGLPVTISALVYPLMYVLTRSTENITIRYIIATMLLSIGYILNIPVRKPGKLVSILLGILAIGVISIILM